MSLTKSSGKEAYYSNTSLLEAGNGRPTNTPCDRWAYPGITAHHLHPCLGQSVGLQLQLPGYSLS